VSEIITGHYLKAGKQLEVTLEAVDVANNRIVSVLLWISLLAILPPTSASAATEPDAKNTSSCCP
jgi:hypothetical protein